MGLPNRPARRSIAMDGNTPQAVFGKGLPVFARLSFRFPFSDLYASRANRQNTPSLGADLEHSTEMLPTVFAPSGGGAGQGRPSSSKEC